MNSFISKEENVELKENNTVSDPANKLQ